jgi:signal transduction histidine kinase
MLGLLGRRLIAGVLFVLCAAAAVQAQPPKRVLMLHSWGPEFGDLYARDMRVQLSRELGGRCELYEQWLVSARFAEARDDSALAGYLNSMFAAHPLDLVITLGAPAANFVERHRGLLFTGTPKLLADVEERRAADSSLTPGETAVAITVSFPTLMQNILRVRPQTDSVAVVIGNSPIEKFWVGQIRDSLEPFNKRVSVRFLTDLTFSEVLRQVASLPARSAILYILLSPDIEGIPPEESTALAQLYAAANAPMFSYTDAYLGKGIVGGPLISGDEQGRAVAIAAARLLAGENPSQVRTVPIALGKPVFDWRELRRWHISESDLPPGSEILFRERSVWERYKWEISATATVLALMSVLIVRLLFEHARWRVAEGNARQRMVELSHMNRRTTVGELSASITHELTQPLSAIGNNASAAGMLLEAPLPDLAELREINSDIAKDQRRAVEVIMRLRGLFTKAPAEVTLVDLGDVVREVFELLSAHAFTRHVSLSTRLFPGPLLVAGDRIQLQQVILNVVMNGVEAIESTKKGERAIVGRTSVDGASAQVSIIDTGPGLPSGTVDQIFEPFFTTKDSGMGMGLSIARSIITSQGGRIWAENRNVGGAAVNFTMPLVRG